MGIQYRVSHDRILQLFLVTCRLTYLFTKAAPRELPAECEALELLTLDIS